MCMRTPRMPTPQLPPERQAARTVSRSDIGEDVGARVRDRIRAGSNTILTSGSGVMQPGTTEKKTLLGA